MEPIKDIKESVDRTDEWISTHLEPSSSRPDLTYYVALDTVYVDYHEHMVRRRFKPMAKYELAQYILVYLAPATRLNERMDNQRLYSHGRGWTDTWRKVWVLDGVRYYRDKIGGQLVFGI